MTIGSEIKKVREAKGLSQEQLAQLAKTSQQNVDRIENGQVMHSRFLPSILEVLGIEDRLIAEYDVAEKNALRSRRVVFRGSDATIRPAPSPAEENARLVAEERDATKAGYLSAQYENILSLLQSYKAISADVTKIEELPSDKRNKIVTDYLISLNPTRTKWDDDEITNAIENLKKNMVLRDSFKHYVTYLSKDLSKDVVGRNALRFFRRPVKDELEYLEKKADELGDDVSVGLRVKIARLRRGMSQKDLAEKVGANQVDIYRIENGEVQYSKYLQAVMQELELGEAPERTIPVVGYIGAGAEIFPIDDYAKGEGFDQIPSPPGITSGIALIVRGDSMWPRYNDGDLVLFEKKERPLDTLSGKTCYVMLEDGRAFLKILQRGATLGVWNLISHNAPPIENVEIQRAFSVAWVKPKN